MAFPDINAARKAATALAIGLFVTTSSMLGSSPALANSADETKNNLTVVVDRARVVRIATPADTIIIGNPSIVDATIQDARTLVLTGRNFGITNLIVLDADGDVIVDETVLVRGHETNLVRIYRQAERETLACSPVCENTVTVGDNNSKFTNTATQIGLRNDLSEGE